MALKSGLVCESTWALDTLTILLYDDHTVTYFNLSHLPGLLQVLLDHFRRCLDEIFELGKAFEIAYTQFSEEGKESEKEAERHGVTLLKDAINERPNVDAPNNYTLKTRQGKTVKIEEHSPGEEFMLDEKHWDVHTGFTNSLQWRLGKGDISQHILTHFEGTNTMENLKKLFFKSSRKRSKSDSDDSADSKAAKLKEEDNNNQECVKNSEEKMETSESGSSGNSSRTETKTEPSESSIVTTDKTTDSPEPSNSSSTSSVSNKQDTACSQKPLDNIKSEKCENEDSVVSSAVKKEEPSADVSMTTGSQPSEPSSVTSETVTPDNQTGADNEKNSDNAPNESNNQTPETSSLKSETSDQKTIDTSTKNKDSNKFSLTTSDSKKSCKSNTDTGSSSSSRKESQYEACMNLKRKLKDNYEEEAYCRDQPVLNLISEAQEELSRRCVCVSNIFRSLSFIPGNDMEMSKNKALLLVLGRLLLLHHQHPERKLVQRRFDKEELDVEDSMEDGRKDWWWSTLDALRENTLVVLSNIAGRLQLEQFPEQIVLPLLDGLLHWAVCPSACAQDSMPTMSSASVLSPHRLSLETLSKLCIHSTNVDLILATGPFTRTVKFFSCLVNHLANRKDQVLREFSIVLLSALVQGDSAAARSIALQHPCVSLLIDFLETAEHNAMQVVNTHGMNMLRDNPDMMGTSLDMLRRTAACLVHIAAVPDNRSLFLHYQHRLLSLVMSQILDQHVAQMVADIMFQCAL